MREPVHSGTPADAIAIAILGCMLAFCGSAQAAPFDFHGQTLTAPNFSLQDLTDANFQGATIIGGVFTRAKLTGAHFDGATFTSVDGHPTQNNDFTLADLTNATFTGAKFNGITYFTFATLTCADFSGTILNNGNAVFGDSIVSAPLTPLQTCRTKFVGATMNCEFIDAWQSFDLSGADVGACITKLAGRSFAGAVMPGVHLDNAILDGTNFRGANLTRATMNGVSLQCAGTTCADLTGALLSGVELNNANLTGASLYGALLSNDTKHNDVKSASLRNAHLKNVNLAGATLSGAQLQGANFYGDNTGTCPTTGGKDPTGFTIGCAKASGTTIDGASFADGFLYGADFSGATITGTNFSRTVLAAATFVGAKISSSPGFGGVTDFTAAYLQGTDLGKATPLVDVVLTDAFFDFPGSNGNNMDVYLTGPVHNSFACGTPSTCSPATGADVCVYISYPVTIPPTQNATITCPDGKDGPCGDPADANGKIRWKSSLNVEKPLNPGPPAGWYQSAATFNPAAPAATMCNGKGDNTSISGW